MSTCRKDRSRLREQALRMVVEHQQDYPSVTAVSKVVADKLGLGKETVRRWVVQAEVDAGARNGLTTEEHAEVKRLKSEVKKLREDNEILKAAFFVQEASDTNEKRSH